MRLAYSERAREAAESAGRDLVERQESLVGLPRMGAPVRSEPDLESIRDSTSDGSDVR